MGFKGFSACTALVVAIGLVLAGCDGTRVVSPSQFTIRLSSVTQTVAPGGAAEISAVVSQVNGEHVPDGTSVTFTTTLGRVEPAQAVTRGGVATATFFAGGVTGLAEIHAAAGGGNAAAVVVSVRASGGEGTVTGSVDATHLGGLNVRATATVDGGEVERYEWIFEGMVPNLVTTTNEGWYTFSTPGHKDFRVRVVLTDGSTLMLTGAIFLNLP